MLRRKGEKEEHFELMDEESNRLLSKNAKFKQSSAAGDRSGNLGRQTNYYNSLEQKLDSEEEEELGSQSPLLRLTMGSREKARRVNSVDNPNYNHDPAQMTINLGDAETQDSDYNSSEPGVYQGAGTSRVRTSEDYRRQMYRRREETQGGMKRLRQIVINISCLFCNFCMKTWNRKRELKSREITIGKPLEEKFTPNVIKNQKYNVITFLPLALFQQFSLFLNLYFLIMALSQFIPDIQIGYWYTYWGPLIFVLTVTLVREAIDDLRRRERDNEINSSKYQKLNREGHATLIQSKNIKVGDLILLEKDQRIPADMVLLRTGDKMARSSCFIRTDQLDGETDWKLRLPVLQDVELDELFKSKLSIYAERPKIDIQEFVGVVKRGEGGHENQEGINLENTLWANTVLAAGNAIGLVIYTGSETRSVMNNSIPRSKMGLIDFIINDLTKILFIGVAGLATLMMILKGWEGAWYRYHFRFILLFSYIIPISLRVNLDMAKAFYAYCIQKCKLIPGTVVRSTTISEDLGRITYLMSDKTGTLTQNEMIFKRLCLETSQLDAPEDCKEKLRQGLRSSMGPSGHSHQRVNEITRVIDSIKALALCHNVTPIYEETPEMDSEMDFGMEREANFQASSPDEIALVKFARSSGLSLVQRDQSEMTLRSYDPPMTLHYQILHIFPFTSDAKRMGIIVKETSNEEIVFYLKGADGVMKNLVKYNEWLDEACGNMAREGLRTLVMGKRVLSRDEYDDFNERYNIAKAAKVDRAHQMNIEMNSLEKDLDPVCVTGVEDTLQADVKITLETLGKAGIKIWMLTGDKLETAVCIAKSSKLVATNLEIYVFNEVSNRTETFTELNNFKRRPDRAVVIRGETLDHCLTHYEKEFMELACASPVVVVCRCSPTQKATVVQLVKKHTKKRTAAIGDGGNDVAMIQASDVGIGIEGKEGRQASLAADFSITQFSHVAALCLVHGRYCYKRSASLSQFVMHRGLIITVMQAVFSSIFYYSSVAFYPGFMMIGYATAYTMFPVFALVLDKDAKEENLLKLPELYADLGKGRSLTYKTFLLMVLISVYQGGVIMYGALILFKDEFIHIISISFTSLILTELIMVAIAIRNIHKLMILAEFVSVTFFALSLLIFHDYFDLNFILSWDYLWKVLLITSLATAPIYLIKKLTILFISRPNYLKLS